MNGFSWFYLTVFFLAFAVSAGFTRILLRHWNFRAGYDFGDLVRKSQQQAVLRVGGIGVFLGLSAVFVFCHWTGRGTGEAMAGGVTLGFLGLCGAIFLLGLADDLRPLKPGLKLAGQIMVAMVAYSLGFRIELISVPFGGGSLELNGLSFLATVVWLVALPNIINMVDGMDGLAGGVGTALCVTLGILSALMGRLEVALLCFGMAGSISGFLSFNLPPAKIYLGDGGAYLIGFFIALASTVVSQKGAVAVALLVVMIGLAFPIADASLAIARRVVYGLPIFRADAEHIHHRLGNLGISKGRLLAGFYVGFLVLSVIGVTIFVSKGSSLPVLTMVICVALVGLAHGLWKVRGGKGEVVAGLRRLLTSRREIRFAHALSRVLELELERSSQGEAYWQSLRDNLVRVGLYTRIPESSEEQGWGEVSVGIRSRLNWKLYHRPDPEGMERDWPRILGCFVPALSEGLRRWEVEPGDIGLNSLAEPASSARDLQGEIATLRKEITVPSS